MRSGEHVLWDAMVITGPMRARYDALAGLVVKLRATTEQFAVAMEATMRALRKFGEAYAKTEG